jgi:predicted methyltransferase
MPSIPRTSVAAMAALAAALTLGASPAAAFDANKLGQGGSLSLSDISSLVDQSAQLKSEVAAALAAAHKTADDIICGGNRFPREWVNLGGMRAAPYTCNFIGKWLSLNATVTVGGPKGEVYDTITPAAMKNADKVTETKPVWKWTTSEPN